MQEENKKDDLIDVGEADESATEINLDEQQPKEDAAKEEKVEVEQVEAKEEKPVEEKNVFEYNLAKTIFNEVWSAFDLESKVMSLLTTRKSDIKGNVMMKD